MTYRTNTASSRPTLQICDATSGSVRLAREYPRHDTTLSQEEFELLQLYREEARHDLFRRSFLLTSERYLKGELPESGLNGEGLGRFSSR
ncbi:hypothetical protein EKK97_02105 [Billgrantia tianxiuensis]|uniref:Uncharacterized protein n=1 Tax=Billgrantia tianxiuensis TaxID=2497861 RepID=A0A6I6SGV5_9GAMM|nr:MULTISPECIES: hypothetical protein [Halomonas]MCE8035772.1 hypothetical protein [Halomonas sp. MCCC 1A11057]QHC48631.1 hypothetical protein EKK97_02105 [Halomonas tianxiuensis]